MPTPLVGGMRPEFLDGYEAPTPELPEMGFLDRAAIGIANAPATAMKNTGVGLANIFGVNPSHLDESIPDAEYLPRPGETFMQKAGDFVGHGLAPMALQIMATGRVVNPMIPAAYPIAGRMATDAAAFGLIGSQEDRLTGAEQAAEGAGYGYITKYSRMARLPAAAALALGSKMFFDRNGEEPIMEGSDLSLGDASALAGFATSVLPGQRPWKMPLKDHFAPVAKTDPLLLTNGPEVINAGYSPRLALEDRALQGELVQEGIPQLRAGPGEVRDGTIYAGGDGTSGINAMDGPLQLTYPPEARALAGRPVRPALTMEGGVVQDYSNITLPEMQARVPQGRIEPGATVHHRSPGWDRGPMEVLGQTRPGFVEVLDPGAAGPVEYGVNALRATAPAMPMPYTRPALWSPQVGKILTEDMFKWGEQFGIAREQMQRLDDAFNTLRIRDNNLKVKLMWDMIRKELQNVEADFNPQKGKPAAFPDALLQMDEQRLAVQTQMAKMSKQELQQLIELEAVKGKMGKMPEGERQLLEAAQIERQRRAWQAQELLRELKEIEPFKGKIGVPEAELQLAEQASHYRARQRFIHEQNGRLMAALREVDSPAQAAKGKTALPEAQVQLDEQAALLRQTQNLEARSQVQQDPSRGKLSPLREWERTQGGSALPELLAPIARAGVGGALGYAAGGEEGMLAGAALGLTPEMLRAFLGASQKAFGGGKNNAGMIRYPFAETPIGKKRIISTAIRLADDKLVTGPNWAEAHPNLLMEALDNGADGMTLMENMGFMAEMNGQVRFVDRRLGALIAKEAGQVDPKFSKEKLTSEDLREWEAAQASTSTGSLRPLQKEGGHLFPELNAAMSRATAGFLIGGGVGGAVDGSEGFFTGGLIGAATLMGGPTLAKTLIEGFQNIKTDPLQGMQSRARGWVNLAKNFGQTFRDKAGNAMTSSATTSDRFVRWLETNLSLSTPLALKEALMNSKGAASALLDTLDTALRRAGWHNPDEGLKKMANQFLDGDIDEAAFLDGLKNRFPGAGSEGYGNLIVTARKVVDGLQKMVADGVGDPKMAAIINKSIGQYLTRSYKLFTNSDWVPKQDSIDRLVQEMLDKKVYPDATREDIQSMIAQYIREVKQTKGVYKMGEGKIGQEVSQQVLRRRKDLSDAWKEFLGEITDPTERVYQTVFRLRPMAEASSYFSKLVNGVKEDGWLPHAFQNYHELFAFEQGLRNQADHLATVAKDSPEHLDAMKKLETFQERWKGQQNVDNHPKFGSLRGRVVTRHVWDTLATYDNLTDNMKSPFLRGMMNAHTAIKLGRTALNPITVVRNFVTMPAFAAIARAHPHDISEAWNIVMSADHPLRKEIMEQGIGNVDQVKTEFYKEFENLTGGKYNFGSVDLTNLGLGKMDFDLAEKIGKRGFRHILDAYRLPDNLVRIGSYLSAKNRIAQQLGKAIDDPDVIAQAARFTNRYTMNYDAVSPIVKKMRQLPFFNLFITYTAEMIRILKNLTEDVIQGNTVNGVMDHTKHGRAYAAIPLAGLAVLPDLMQASSESNLSPQDRVEWERTKKMMPDYARTRYRGWIKRDKKTGKFDYQDFTPLIASDSLNQLVRAVSSGDMEAAKSVNPFLGWENTPLWNIAREQTAGEDLRTGRQFRGKLGEFRNTADRLASAAREALPPWFPPAGSEWQKLIQATSTNAEGGTGITNTRTGVRLTPADFLQPYLTGVRGGEVSPDVLEKRVISEVKREMANETAYLNDVLNSDLPDEKKNRAVEVFRVVAAELQDKLRQRLERPSDRK